MFDLVPFAGPRRQMTNLDEQPAVKKIMLGVGDTAAPKAGGAGMLYLDDIGFGHPVQ